MSEVEIERSRIPDNVGALIGALDNFNLKSVFQTQKFLENCDNDPRSKVLPEITSKYLSARVGSDVTDLFDFYGLNQIGKEIQLGTMAFSGSILYMMSNLTIRSEAIINDLRPVDVYCWEYDTERFNKDAITLS